MAREAQYDKPFATLSPFNEAAIRQASHVYEVALRQPQIYRHHLGNMRCTHTERVRLRSLLYPLPLSTLAPLPATLALPDLPLASSYSSEGTDADEENDSLNDLVWPVSYAFSFTCPPLLPRLGWTAGYGHGWEQSAPAGKVDLLISVGVSDRRDDQLRSKHAHFNFVLPSGQFATRQCKPNARLTVGEEHVGEHFRFLLRPDELVAFGGLQYRLAYTVAESDQANFQTSKDNYFTKHLQTALPNSFTSGTPSPNDVRFDRWTLMTTAGAGSGAVVRGAVSVSGTTAAVVRQEFFRPSDKNRTDDIVNLLEDIKEKLGRRNAPGKAFVAELHDTLETRAGEMYLITLPLGLTTFQGELFDQNRQCHAQLFAQVVAGLASLHDAGFLHNDIKPGNLVVHTFEPPKAVIIDLASARDMNENVYAAGVKATPGRSGTIGFLAPEREASSSSRYGFPSDMWSLGTVGLQVLIEKNCHAPFDVVPQVNPFRDYDLAELDQEASPNSGFLSATDHQRLRCIALDCVRDLDKSAKSRPTSVESLLSGMLAVKPANRISANQAMRHPFIASLLEQGAENGRAGNKRKVKGQA